MRSLSVNETYDDVNMYSLEQPGPNGTVNMVSLVQSGPKQFKDTMKKWILCEMEWSKIH